MSGESPREENRVDTTCGTSVADPSQLRTCGVVATAPVTVPTQASRQQLIEGWPFGQQESREAAECEMPAVWQAADMRGEIPAKATTEP